MVTMRDVAQRAGVSIATVSFVLNDTKPVTAATRAKIEQAMAELGFRRNVVARALASRRTHIIAMAYPALDHKFGFSAAEFFTSAADAARKQDYHLVLWPVGNDGSELTELVGQGLVDGVVLMEVQLDDPRVSVLRETGTPFAMIGRTSALEGLSHVDIDFDQTVEDAVEYVYGLGHRRLALISGNLNDPLFSTYGPYVRSEAAYRRIAPQYGIETVVMESSGSTLAGQEAMARLVRDHPETTAVLIVNEFAALGAVSGLNRLGRRIPEDISVLPLLMAPEMAALTNPELTIMRTPGPELGQLGTEALIRQLEGADPLPPQLVPAKLHPGATTAPPPS
ncbi:DNA-binding LacI/PurR family transcriptional regulator [Kribbella antiqua]|uniref:DNA-binding LacI/PurR family transcriptional regulator n=1 Tax=Kribbella antiqua TaxID=2512217 RepID=A0A4R2IVH0_9ACTN|nr:LacI family DNA-binding transcriptional regulator [Kribbella antiqua]TCO49593.1 DNA-binding LacI/PurR family transcriptional regulator [Kribbella antiqua]